jgi:hypothetical protein
LVFTQFRDTAAIISKRLNEIHGIRAKVFVGQAKKTIHGKETGLKEGKEAGLKEGLTKAAQTFALKAFKKRQRYRCQAQTCRWQPHRVHLGAKARMARVVLGSSRWGPTGHASP